MRDRHRLRATHTGKLRRYIFRCEGEALRPSTIDLTNLEGGGTQITQSMHETTMHLGAQNITGNRPSRKSTHLGHPRDPSSAQEHHSRAVFFVELAELQPARAVCQVHAGTFRAAPKENPDTRKAQGGGAPRGFPKPSRSSHVLYIILATHDKPGLLKAF